MLYIRADGNPNIGTGHIMRCLSIADAVKKRGGAASFIVADNNMRELISKYGYDIICLDSLWNNLDVETDTIHELIKTNSVEKLLIDSYYVTPTYLDEISNLTHVIYIDDLNMFHYTCDMLINYNYYADESDYLVRYPSSKLLFGCRYAPLREEFQNLTQRVTEKEVLSVLVTVGGTDIFNIAYKIVKLAKACQEISHLTYHIVAGRFNQHIGALDCLAIDYDGVIIHKDVQSMSRLMLDCDIAVSAGGSTLYELCACGIPSVVFAMADNQLEAIRCFGNDYMINAGDFRENEEQCLGNAVSGVRHLASGYDLRREMSGKVQKLVDGSGAMRIAESIISISGKKRKEVRTVDAL